jgi:hypothetical protein
MVFASCTAMQPLPARESRDRQHAAADCISADLHKTFTDVLFALVVGIPAAFVSAGELGGAMMVFVPLLAAACFVGAWEQQHGA